MVAGAMAMAVSFETVTEIRNCSISVTSNDDPCCLRIIFDRCMWTMDCSAKIEASEGLCTLRSKAPLMSFRRGEADNGDAADEVVAESNGDVGSDDDE